MCFLETSLITQEPKQNQPKVHEECLVVH